MPASYKREESEIPKVGKVLQSALVFLQYLEIYSLKCRDCLVSQFYLNIRLNLHSLSLPKLPNLQFTQIPNYQIWIMSCETFSVNIFLLLIFHFLSIPFSPPPFIIGVSILYKCTFFCFCFIKKFNEFVELNI